MKRNCDITSWHTLIILKTANFSVLRLMLKYGKLHLKKARIIVKLINTTYKSSEQTMDVGQTKK